LAKHFGIGERNGPHFPPGYSPGHRARMNTSWFKRRI